ncbi:MAG: ABC transporter permease, partial [Actinobacteria bacterium]
MELFADAIAEGASLLSTGGLDVWTIVVTSVRVSGAATLIALVLGVPLGYLIGSKRFL